MDVFLSSSQLQKLNFLSTLLSSSLSVNNKFNFYIPSCGFYLLSSSIVSIHYIFPFAFRFCCHHTIATPGVSSGVAFIFPLFFLPINLIKHFNGIVLLLFLQIVAWHSPFLHSLNVWWTTQLMCLLVARLFTVILVSSIRLLLL